MKTKQPSLFSKFIEYISNVPVGQTFTTKDLTNKVGKYEETTRWKSSNGNPYYRTHTYKSYLRRAGFVSPVKKGVWKIEYKIPSNLTCSMLEHVCGVKDGLYKGKTKAQLREEIFNSKPSPKSEPIPMDFDSLRKINSYEQLKSYVNIMDLEEFSYKVLEYINYGFYISIPGKNSYEKAKYIKNYFYPISPTSNGICVNPTDLTHIPSQSTVDIMADDFGKIKELFEKRVKLEENRERIKEVERYINELKEELASYEIELSQLKSSLF